MILVVVGGCGVVFFGMREEWMVNGEEGSTLEEPARRRKW